MNVILNSPAVFLCSTHFLYSIYTVGFNVQSDDKIAVPGVFK